jgi:hypothetical protein
MNEALITADRVGQELGGPFEGVAWYLLIADDPKSAAEQMRDVLEAVELDHQLILADSPRALFQTHPSKMAVLVEVGNWAADLHADLERLRALIRARWTRLLWFATAEQAAALIHQAPNFASFLLPDIARFSEGNMDDATRQAHLTVLQARYGMTNAEVITQATQGALPGDADHHTWLILLGRGDLIADAQ